MFPKFITALLLLNGCCHRSWAQSGYNYARPELANASGNVPTGVGGVGGVGLRANILPSAYPTATATGTAPATPATAYGGFAGQPATAYTPSGVAQGQATFGAPVGSGAGLKRPSSPQAQPTRPGGSAYGQYTPASARLPTATGTGGGLVDNDYSEGDYSAIPGVPGVDYPVYAQVPRTNFDCAQQPLPGYYSDIEAQCQVFHICALNRTYSFLCPNGTVFSQETLVCVWWNQYDCGTAPSLYANNAFIYDYDQRGSGGGSVGTSAANANVNLNTGFQLGRVQPSNTARTPSNAGVYSSGVALRSTVGPQPTGSGAGVAGYIGANTATRAYTPTPTVAGGGQFGAVIRPSGGVPVGNPLIPDTSNTIAGGGQATSANREYLPPTGGRRN